MSEGVSEGVDVACRRRMMWYMSGYISGCMDKYINDINAHTPARQEWGIQGPDLSHNASLCPPSASPSPVVVVV